MSRESKKLNHRLLPFLFDGFGVGFCHIVSALGFEGGRVRRRFGTLPFFNFVSDVDVV